MQRQQSKSKRGLRIGELFAAWKQILCGRVPMLSIEITRECPLSCPGCYAYGDTHLGGGLTLRQISDLRGDALVAGVLDLVDHHRPIHVSLVGGEPLVRHRELDRILPALSQRGVFTMVVTSAVIPIPTAWMALPRVRVAVSVDGLPEHHDVRRHPATYERILKNIAGREVNIHWTITRLMLGRQDYVEQYIAFWNGRPEVNRIWASLYSPQVGEHTPEMLTPPDRQLLAEQLPRLRSRYPKFLMNEGIAQAYVDPPQDPTECLFATMSVNYSADLKTRVEPCIFGGTPDCRQCGCAISGGLHWFKKVPVFGPLKIDHLVRGSVALGRLVNRLRSGAVTPARWQGKGRSRTDLVRIGS